MKKWKNAFVIGLTELTNNKSEMNGEQIIPPITDPSGQRYCGLVVGCAGLQGLAQVDSVCCSGSCGRRRQDRYRTWSEERRSSHLGPWSRPRIFCACAQRAWHPCHFHSGCDPDPAQWRPSFQASPRLIHQKFFILLNPASVAAC